MIGLLQLHAVYFSMISGTSACNQIWVLCVAYWASERIAGHVDHDHLLSTVGR